jgi:hypothetical protein
MEGARIQGIPLRTLAFFTVLATVVGSGANGSAFGQQRDKQKKPISTNREPSAGSNAAQAIMEAQAPLATAAERIQKLDSDGTRLGGIELEVEKHTLNVWWNGDPPAELRNEIASQERGGGIKVILQPAKYSQRELIEAARSITSKAQEYPGLVSAGPLVDGSGLEIGVSDIERAASFKFPMPVHVVLRKGMVPLFSRGADTPPWWAGAVTKAAVPNAGTCSTGFAMTQGSTHGILTAEHCACGGNVVFNNGVGVPIGVAEPGSTQNPSTDSLFITANSGAATYDGGVGVGEFSKPVVGRQSSFRGLFVCSSGAATGVHCGIKIDITKLFFSSSCFAGRSIEGGVIATQVDGTVAAGSGDSGGPVFTLAQDPSTVNAAGIIFDGINQTPCQGFGTVCFNMVAFTDIDTLRSAHNADVLVPQQSGGATIVSMGVFGCATFLWTLVQLHRRRKTQFEGLPS